MISRQERGFKWLYKRLTIFCSLIFLTTMFLVFSVTRCFSRDAYYEREIHGESGAWTMMIHYPWLGGSYTQIQYVISKSEDNSLLKRTFQILGQMATSADAVVMTMEDGNLHPAILYIDYSPTPFPFELPKDQVFEEEMYKKGGAKVIQQKLVAGSTCQFVRTEGVKSAGYPTIRGYFNCSEPSGVQTKSLFEIIGRPNDHVSLLLFVDSRVSVQRFRDYASMLQTFRFSK